ncbi:unnamed protein product [Symbiodinium necroappetens]|uniref:SAM domain-containing protein n=1 Tax=Symbiodinium necroappetens TaxID=1628268 RepID=A0A812YBM4_9DINO|nr:unnamed protein product [Symbiodinium necroappetens]
MPCLSCQASEWAAEHNEVWNYDANQVIQWVRNKVGITDDEEINKLAAQKYAGQVLLGMSVEDLKNALALVLVPGPKKQLITHITKLKAAAAIEEAKKKLIQGEMLSTLVKLQATGLLKAAIDVIKDQLNNPSKDEDRITMVGEMLSTLAQLDADQCMTNALRDAAFAQVLNKSQEATSEMVQNFIPSQVAVWVTAKLRANFPWGLFKKVIQASLTGRSLMVLTMETLQDEVGIEQLGVRQSLLHSINAMASSTVNKVRMVETDELGPLCSAQQVDETPQHNLVDLERPIKACLECIKKWTWEEDSTNRIPPACAIRCARGGKTTFLIRLFQRLKQDQSDRELPIPIWVTFNGSTRVLRQKQESSMDWLCRTVAHAIAHAKLKEQLANGSMSCSEDNLAQFFAKQESYVLLIDELNLLLTGEDSEADGRVANFLKNHFLKGKGQYLVFTSHIQATQRNLCAYMESPSSRPVQLIQLSLARTMEELISMHDTCQGLTPTLATFFGRIPSMVWCAISSERTVWSNAVDTIIERARKKPKALIGAFLQEVLRGKRHPDLEEYMALTDIGDGGVVKWLPCYMAAFLSRCGPPYEKLGEWLQGLQQATAGAGKGWEMTVAVAFGLRYLWAQQGHLHEFAVGGDDSVKLIELKDARFDARDMQSATEAISLPKPEHRPSLQLVMPSHACFQKVDLFALRTEVDGSRKVVMASQQKEGRHAVDTEAPAVEGKALWMRGQAGQERTSHGWYQPSSERINEFLGPSLQSASPAAWLDMV